ncbi:MAG TPA: FecR domain-containing protein, partial [Puia sp.]|nr:FecR domain-containing protein [Puia sp.]
RTVLIRRVSIAAVLILLAGIGLAYLSVYLTDRHGFEFVSGGQVWTGALPDGSSITLNKHSTLSCNRSYNSKDRDVRLTGEAFFAVAPNDRLPFVIHAQGILVEVLGTSFNVMTAEDKTAIIVETGEVRVKKDSLIFYLHAGEKLTLSRTGLSPVKQTNTDPLYNYYRTKKFVCKATPLRELVAALNNAYDQHIVLADQQDGDMPITVTFTDNSMADILAVICSTLQLTTVRQGDTIILKKRNASL